MKVYKNWNLRLESVFLAQRVSIRYAVRNIVKRVCGALSIFDKKKKKCLPSVFVDPSERYLVLFIVNSITKDINKVDARVT